MGMFTGEFYAQSLRMTTQLKVIFPDPSNDADPVVGGEPAALYLLHGLGANAGEWTRFSKIEYYAKKYNLIVVMPEVQRSFYLDAACGPRFLTYVGEELPEICRTWFRMPGSREKTFIAGESMGGYGAVKCALRRPKQYGAAASLSGVLDFPRLIRDVRAGLWGDFSSREADALLGPGAPVPPEEDVLALVRKEAQDPDRPRMIQLCGTEDFLYADNLRFKAAAEAAGYGHTYLEWPGEHAWPFWDVAIQRAIQFFYELDLRSTPIY